MRALLAVGVSSLVALVLGAAACVGDDPDAVKPGTTADAAPADGSDTASGEAGTDAGHDTGTSCTAPLADCDGNGSCETSTATEPKHCGVCGHDCGGGACVGGRCQPQMIGSNVDAPLSLAVNSSGVFWLRSDSVEKCPKAGCIGPPTVLASSSTQVDVLARRHIFVDETKAYWLGDAPAAGTNIYIFACDVGGCGKTPTPIGDYTGVGQLVGNATSLVWYDSTGGLMRVPIAGGSTEYLSLAYRGESFGFAVDDTWLVFSNTDFSAGGAGGVWLGKVENKAPTKVMDKGRHVAIAGGTTVLASVDLDASRSTVISCPVTGCGGTGTPLFQMPEGTINDIVADATAVYWAVKASAGAADGKIRACRLPGCPGGPETVADAQANPYALALDGDFVYWANKGTGAANTGSIQRVRR